jgi:hypothetical protein
MLRIPIDDQQVLGHPSSLEVSWKQFFFLILAWHRSSVAYSFKMFLSKVLYIVILLLTMRVTRAMVSSLGDAPLHGA